MGTQTAEEAKQGRIAAMGEPLGLLFHALWQEVAWLHRKWDDYVTLFGTKPSRVELLNKAAPLFFGVVESVMWEDTLLHIARLTDSPSMGKRANLVIQRLAPLIDHTASKKRIKELTTKAETASAFCRDWRNRRFAHLDLDHALDRSAKPLPVASRAKVKLALAAIGAVLNGVALHYMDSTISFKPRRRLGRAESLLYIVDDDIRVEGERRERLARRESVPGDVRKRDL